MTIPQDPVMLLSYINTQLRDQYPSLDELVKSLDLNKQDIIKKLSVINYDYDALRNQFV